MDMVVGVRRVLLRTDPEGLYGRDATIGIDDLLREPRLLTGDLRIETFRIRERAEIGVERSVFLIQNEDILDLLPQQGGNARVRGRLLRRRRGDGKGSLASRRGR